MRKKKIAMSIFVAVCVISTIVGYSLIKKDSNKYDQLAVMVKQDDGTYIKSNMSTFGNEEYEFDHAVCNNGTTVTANSNGGLNLKFLGTDKCTVYLSLKPKNVIEKIKKYAKSSTSSMYSAVEPTNTISSVADDEFSKGQQTYTVDATHQGYYMTYADSYTFNKPATSSVSNYPSYTLTSPQVGKYSDIYSSLAGKYIVNYEGHNSSTAAYSGSLSTTPYTGLDKIYKVVSATANSITYIPSSYTMEFTNNGTTGVYIAEDDYGTSYYFRGNVTNNYVKFGKWTEEVYRGYNSNQLGYKEYFTKDECTKDGTYNYGCNKSPIAGKDMYWRIVRINGDGSLRLMYDGTEAHANGTRSLDRFALSNQKFNTSNYRNAYVGYMYGSTSTSATYAQVHANTNSSAIKTALETWYEKNFVGTEYASKIVDMSFCNDRSVTSGSGIGTTETSYGAVGRLKTNKTPSLVCPQKHDLFTVEDVENGNGDLTYPVGLLTADEVALAGGVNGSYNRGCYINKGNYYWLGSPNRYSGSAGEFFVGPGFLGDGYDVDALNGAVPVINLSAEAASQLGGLGTMDDPYQKPVIDRIKAAAKPSINTMYQSVEPKNTISSMSDDNFSKGEQTYIVDAAHQNYYMTYADNYTFNEPTYDWHYPTYTLTSSTVGKYSEIYGSLAGKYIVNYEGHNSSTAAYSNSIDRIYKVVSATATSITYIPSSYTMEFTNNGTTGVYTTEDDYGTSYYFRGNVINNYVKFGKWTNEVYRGYNSNQSEYKEYFTQEECAKNGTYKYGCNKSPVAGKDMYWRIVRINGDGTLRLMYDGTEAHANGTKSLDRVAIQYQPFNTNKDNNAYIGYMYGDINGTTYAQVHSNTNPSAIKTALDTWYEKNFLGTTYASKIGNMSFCNDRSIVADSSGTVGTGIGTTNTSYGAYERLTKNKNPSLVCPQKTSDLFTSNSSIQGGNGILNKPVGLLTADEIALAGVGYNSYTRGYYMNKGYNYRLGSPRFSSSSHASVHYVNPNGNLVDNAVDNAYGAVPVINLSAEAANQLVGAGTMKDPYHF